MTQLARRLSLAETVGTLLRDILDASLGERAERDALRDWLRRAVRSAKRRDSLEDARHDAPIGRIRPVAHRSSRVKHTRTKRATMRNAHVARPTILGLILLGIAAVASGAQVVTSSESREKKPMSSVPAQQGTALSRTTPADKPTIVLVHGAFADGSTWQDVVPLLQRSGYKVISVQNSLAMLAEDVATTKRVIDAETRRGNSVVAVGHSYGGAVITGAAAGNAKVKALVFIAAFAPDANEPVGAFDEKYPSPLAAALVPDAAGFLYIDVAKYHEVFAGDLTTQQTRVMAVGQRPVHSAILRQSVPTAAWRVIPSWYLVAQEDRAISPELERFYAKRMNAKTSEIKSSHLPFISQPQKVAALIEEAAGANPR